MASVKLTNVKKIYQGNVVAVHDFNLDIMDKEFIVFVGPSGCGKSTTLRMIAGLEDISEGTCEIDGVVVNDLQPKDRNIAMVFQNYALYPHLSVFENMAFALRLNKFNITRDLSAEEIAANKEKAKALKDHINDYNENEKAAIKEKIEKLLNDTQVTEFRKMTNDEIFNKVTEAAKVLGIEDLLLRKPRALSGGQRQRVAIGRAMVRDSKVFLMDEPLSNLDAKLRNQMRAEIILLRKKIDTTFIYVTHDQTEAMTLGDRIVIMKLGYIQQVGTPTEVFEMPKNLFVAEFIGAPKMNIIPTKLICEDGKYYVTPFGSKILVDGVKGEMLKERNIETRDILLGVRPEHMTISNEDSESSFAATLTVNEMMGSEYHLHFIKDTDSNIIVRVPTMNLSNEERASLVYGATKNITFEGKVMHFFDPETNLNILVDQDDATKNA